MLLQQIGLGQQVTRTEYRLRVVFVVAAGVVFPFSGVVPDDDLLLAASVQRGVSFVAGDVRYGARPILGGRHRRARNVPCRIVAVHGVALPLVGDARLLTASAASPDRGVLHDELLLFRGVPYVAGEYGVLALLWYF